MMNQVNKFINKKYKVIDIFLIIILALLFCALYLECTKIRALRHDSLVMVPTYDYHLIEEGRWLNLIFFPFLKTIDPQISIFLCLICWLYFSYTVARRFTDDKSLQFIIALLFMQIPSFYSVIGWPLVILPAFILLAFTTYLVNRTSYKIVFLTMGILFFGSLNNFYNLILLFYIKEILQIQPSKTIKLFIWWIIGFLAGYLVMLLIVKFLSGNWGLQIASWREPNEIHQLNDLFINLKTAWYSLEYNLKIINLGNVVYYLLGLSFAICLLFKKIKHNNKALIAFLCILAVAFAGYIQSFPLGLFIRVRTAVGFYAAIFMLTLFLCHYARNLGYIFVLTIGCCAFICNYDSIHFYTSVTNVWRDSFISMNINPNDVNLVHICATDNEVDSSESAIIRALKLKNVHQENFNLNWRQFSILQSAGFSNFDTDLYLCSEYSHLPRQENKIHSWTYADKQLFIWYK